MPGILSKCQKCDRCFFYDQNPYLICAVHPGGVENDYQDFRDNNDRQSVIENFRRWGKTSQLAEATQPLKAITVTRKPP
jgi:hypothetical protein